MNKTSDCGRTTRRGFLKKSAAASAAVAVPWVIPSAVHCARANEAPSERISVALIGKGIMGSGHLRRLAGDPGIHVPAVCDVDALRRQEAAKVVEQTYAANKSRAGYKGCDAYNDYRELLARDDVDAVVIVTPDHWHTPISIDAVKAGKDVYCEKPVSMTIAQGRRLVETVQRYGSVFQTGTQYRSAPTIRAVCNFVRGGGLGKIKKVYTLWGTLGGFVGAPRFNDCRALVSTDRVLHSYTPLDFGLPAEPVPQGLDWDMWVGPGVWQPYNKAFHINPMPGVVPWSFCEDFGAGAITWYHSHSADVIQYALGYENDGPVEILHPADSEFPTVTCRYENGTLLHLVDHWCLVPDVYKGVPADARLAGNFGGIFVGERGWLTSMTTGGPIEGGPAEIFDEMNLKTREANIGENNHHANWFECIRTRGRTSCGEEIGHRSASLGHLTIIAHKLKRSLKWDPQAEKFIGDDQANRLCECSTRSPWRI